MGNRSRFVAMTAATGAALLAARRRARLRRAAVDAGEAVFPSAAVSGIGEPAPPSTGHAPGHRHLPGDDPGRSRFRRAPWSSAGRDVGLPHPRG